LANLLLILGMCFLLGGLRFREQVGFILFPLSLSLLQLERILDTDSCVGKLYNSAITQMSACLLSLSVISLLLPVNAAPSSLYSWTHAKEWIRQLSMLRSAIWIRQIWP
jgi:Ca2+/H+ antiporter